MNVVHVSARKVSAAFACILAFSSIVFPSAAADAMPQPMAATGIGNMLQVLFGLGLVLAVIAGMAWALRRFAPGQVAASGTVRVVGGVAVGPKERVVLVDVGETRLVLGVAPGYVCTLLEMPRPAEELIAGKVEEGGGKFYARLKEILQAKGGLGDTR